VSRVQIPLATPTSSLARYDVPMAVKWRVDELAERKGWNARRLAEKAGVDIKTARNILTGQATRVDLETIGRLRDALGVEPASLWRRAVDHELGADSGVISGLVLDELVYRVVLTWLRDSGDTNPMSTFRKSAPAVMRRMRGRLRRLWKAIDEMDFEIAVTDRSVTRR